jgi:hypothetical protein
MKAFTEKVTKCAEELHLYLMISEEEQYADSSEAMGWQVAFYLR